MEAFQPGHRRGSSHGSARIFRRAYPDPLYVRLTGQAQVLWRQLADEAGEELVTTTGAVDYGPALPGTMYQILTGFGVPAELMKAEAAAERWPGISFGRDPVLYHPDGGVIDPERAMAAMRGIAAARGAQICYGSPVLRVEADGAGATVHTADRSWRAPVVIVAAGAWLEPLLGGQVPLPPLCRAGPVEGACQHGCAAGPMARRRATTLVAGALGGGAPSTRYRRLTAPSQGTRQAPSMSKTWLNRPSASHEATHNARSTSSSSLKHARSRAQNVPSMPRWSPAYRSANSAASRSRSENPGHPGSTPTWS